MNAAAAHTAAQPALEDAGFWLEDFLGVFMHRFADGRMLSCAYDWSGSGAWEAQLTGPNGEELGGEDFATAAEVVAYRAKLEAA